MKIFTRLLLFCLTIVALSGQLKAQVASYSFAQSSGTYTEITGGTQIAIATSTVSLDDVVYGPFTIPSFTYAGSPYTTFYVSTNGFISFGTAMSSTIDQAISVLTGGPVICPWARDINGFYNIAGRTSEIRWEQVGNEIVIQWKDFRPAYSTSTTLVYGQSFQIRLNITDNSVKIVYSGGSYAAGSTAISGSSTTAAPQVGLRGTITADFKNRENNATVLFTASTAGTVNTANQYFNTVTAPPGMPTAGLTYTWTPPNCSGPTLSATSINNASCPTSYSYTFTVTNMGSATSYAVSNANGYTCSPTTVTSANTVVTVGPIPSGSASGITTLTHNIDALCNGTVASLTNSCPPANDNCATATPFPTIPTDGSCVILSNQSTAGATNSNVTPTGSCTSNSGTPDDDVWFSFVAPGTSVILEATWVSGVTDVYWQVFSGSCASSMTAILCTDTNAGGTLTGLTQGATYYIRLYTWGSGVSSVQNICLKTPLPPPANNACSGAIELIGTVSGSTALATNVEGLSACTLPGGGGNCAAGGDGFCDFTIGVWYYYLSTGPEDIEINTEGSSFDTELQIFSGTCGALTCVGGDDDSGTGVTSSICFASTANFAPVTYYIYVDGHSTNVGSYILNIVSTPLPVELISFEGQAMEKENKLTWATASEENTEWHILERSVNGQNNWTEIGRKRAAGTTSDIQRYEMMDKAPVASAYYRLQSLDFDARFEYSNIIQIERENGAGDLSVYPNPVRNILTVDYTLDRPEEVTINVTDIAGKLISSEVLFAERGLNQHNISMQNLQSGVYFITMISTNGNVTKRVVKN